MARASPVWIAIPYSSGEVVSKDAAPLPQAPNDLTLGHPSLHACAVDTQSFAIVRHPLDRFCAAWARWQARQKTPAPDINKFVARIWSYLHLPDFTPQHRFVTGSVAQPRCLCLPLERPRLLRTHLQQWGYVHRKPDDIHPSPKQLSADSLQLLSAIYYRDFDLFGYALPVQRSSILDVLQATARAGRAPALVFYSRKFKPIYRRWRTHHDAYATRPVVAVYLKEATEPAARHVVNWDKPASLADLWRARLHQFCFLMLNGLDFVHFDADAFVLRAYDDLLDHRQAPLIFSLGEAHPRAVQQKLGLVGCCGFFAVHSARVPVMWLRHLMRPRNFDDDQRRFNEFFLQQTAYMLANPMPYKGAPRRLRFLRAQDYDDVQQRLQTHLARYGARLFDKQHRPIVAFLPGPAVARGRYGRFWRQKSIWHIKLFYHNMATQDEAQWSALKQSRPFWYLVLRKYFMRTLKYALPLRWRRGIPSQ